MSRAEGAELRLSPCELVSLYLRLGTCEAELDASAHGVLVRLRDLLYERLSIDEMEHLEDYYAVLLAAERKGFR